VSKNFGFETTQLFLGLIFEQYKNIAANYLTKNSSLQSLKERNLKNKLFPWTILKYERIASADPSTDLIISASSVHPLAFREQLRYLKDNCNVVSLNSLIADLKANNPISSGTVVLTFDGGYKDNFEVAFPILKEMSLVGTFFIPTEVIGSETLPWQDQVANAVSVLVDSKRELPVFTSIEPAIAQQLKESFDRTRSKAFLIRGLVAAMEIVAPLNRDECLAELSEAISGLKYNEPERVYLNWDEVWQINDSGMEIGSLGRFGIPLTELSTAELAEELHVSYDTLFNMDINPSRIFALPKGMATRETESFLFSMGFPYAVGENYFTPVSIPKECQILERVAINRANSPSLDRFICRIGRVKVPLSKGYF
jgi:peptidoglycan/xylan/chitin deacetylase (PgdA/CDA1 family)